MLQLYTDYRLGGKPRYYLAEKEDRMLVPNEVRDCTVFLMCNSVDGMRLLGTGFFVGVEYKEEVSILFVYLITARHVIGDAIDKSVDGKVYIRLNDKSGGWSTIETETNDWKYHPTEEYSVDVATFPLAPPMNQFEYRTIPIELFAGNDLIEKESIGVGDEIFLTGLFAPHVGKQRNLPIVRVGNIAAMPEEKVSVEHYGEIDAYLIECRSIEGLSGSPVFVHISRMIPRKKGDSLRPQNQFYFLGLIHGHWDEKPAFDSISDTAKKGAINMGIAIVVPAAKILEVVRHPDYLVSEEKHMKERRNKYLPTPDSLDDENEEVFTKKDFFDALEKSSTPKKPGLEKKGTSE